MASDKLFNFLIYENGKLAYSKYNFNFNLYAKDTNRQNETKINIFENFLHRNGFNLSKPTTLNPSLKKYFLPMTEDIKAYVSKYGVIHSVFSSYVGLGYSTSDFEQNQFDLYPYSTNIIIQDFTYTDSNNVFYSKFNFNFDEYATDFNIPDNKLVIFTDFIFRNYKYSANPKYIGTEYYNLVDGYIVLPEFTKYFHPMSQDPSFMDFLINTAVTSINDISAKSFNKIDFTKYPDLNLDLPTMTLEQAKEHFLTFGQFEVRTLKFVSTTLTNIELAKRGVCTVFLKNKLNSPISTGFLYGGNTGNNFLITTYHMLEEYPDQRYLYAIFENDTNTSFIAQFQIIGYDIVSDIVVALYDPNLNFNQNIFKPDFSKQLTFEIDYDFTLNVGETLYTIGNLDMTDNLSIGTVNLMNKNYGGGFGGEFSSHSNLMKYSNAISMIPNSYLLQSVLSDGISGAPLLQKIPNDNTTPLKYVGMIIGSLKSNSSYLLAINGLVLDNIFDSIIQRWKLAQTLNLDSIKLEKYISNGVPKTWLGTINVYYHPLLSGVYKELSNFKYVGGLLITNFIVGFNYIKKEFIYTSKDLLDKNVVEISGPLLKTNLYKRFISNGNVPIVISSIIYYDSVSDEFKSINIGKFSNQQSFSDFVYNNRYISLIPSDSKYYNNFTSIFSGVRIVYYYFDGSDWVKDVENVLGNSVESYVDYADNTGNIYHQHKLEFPTILLPYFTEYSLANLTNSNYIDYH